MKIMFLGGEYPELAATLSSLGYDPVHLSPDPEEPEDFPPHMRWLRRARKMQPPAFRDWLVREVSASGAEALVVFKGFEGSRVRVDPMGVAALRRRGLRTIFWSLDDPFFESGVRALRGHASAAAYEWYLTCDGATLEKARASGRKAELCWPAYDKLLWGGADSSPWDTGPDLLLVGSVYDGAGWGQINRVSLVRAAVDRGLNVEVYGPARWMSAGIPDGVYRGYLPSEMNGVHNRAARCVFSSHVRRSHLYLNARTFQVMGAGGVLLTDRQPGIDGTGPATFMMEGVNHLQYGSLEEAVELAWEISRPEAKDRRHGIRASAASHVNGLGQRYKDRAAVFDRCLRAPRS